MQHRGLGVAAGILAACTLILSLSGWFALLGLGLAIPTMVYSRAIRVRGPFILAAAAASASAVWMLLDLLAS
jgi:hypothetical protein